MKKKPVLQYNIIYFIIKQTHACLKKNPWTTFYNAWKDGHEEEKSLSLYSYMYMYVKTLD